MQDLHGAGAGAASGRVMGQAGPRELEPAHLEETRRRLEGLGYL